jgi:hypothetical protein
MITCASCQEAVWPTRLREHLAWKHGYCQPPVLRRTQRAVYRHVSLKHGVHTYKAQARFIVLVRVQSLLPCSYLFRII